MFDNDLFTELFCTAALVWRLFQYRVSKYRGMAMQVHRSQVGQSGFPNSFLLLCDMWLIGLYPRMKFWPKLPWWKIAMTLTPGVLLFLHKVSQTRFWAAKNRLNTCHLNLKEKENLKPHFTNQWLWVRRVCWQLLKWQQRTHFRLICNQMSLLINSKSSSLKAASVPGTMVHVHYGIKRKPAQKHTFVTGTFVPRNLILFPCWQDWGWSRSWMPRMRNAASLYFVLELHKTQFCWAIHPQSHVHGISL